MTRLTSGLPFDITAPIHSIIELKGLAAAFRAVFEVDTIGTTMWANARYQYSFLIGCSDRGLYLVKLYRLPKASISSRSLSSSVTSRYVFNLQ